jgi:hypothetical protein
MTPNAPLLAAAVAALFAASGCTFVSTADTEQSVVKCQGVNECRGQGECGGVNSDGSLHGCTGNNECKGQGWIELPKAECAERGGTPIR